MRNRCALPTALLLAISLAPAAAAAPIGAERQATLDGELTLASLSQRPGEPSPFAIDRSSSEIHAALDFWRLIADEPAIDAAPITVATPLAIPELSTLTLLTGGLAALFLMRRYSGWL